ncbi:hypothetical protein [Desulfosporosinus youngiae]|uniref:Uncharacterized protein n=1 Tax=Desulfosporosinus youngiae DSM 17734 TaxID=768710 RepID=H5Y0R2_9FIRM|nr:hypothetical protein [Desulfosporosinus youngiae]EHQ92318.1 hypothetical protein DesyoDRAFT_5392 [Desulfosporosinus youngiae DSM 17734]
MSQIQADVLSVAARNTYPFIVAYSVHACPNEGPRFQYRPSKYITFRNPQGGEMEKLYLVDKTVVLNPYEPTLEERLGHMESSYSKRIAGYIKERFLKWEFSHHNEDYRFYILSEKGQIELPHAPKPSVNNSGGWYYTLAELLSGKKIVEVESRAIGNRE